MGLFDKLKEILFDEEQVEVPVEKEDNEEKKVSVKQTKTLEDEDIVVKQIKTPPKKVDDDLFDMPRLKEEAETEVRTSTFTFPVFDDDLDIKETSRVTKHEEKQDTKKNFKRFDFSSKQEKVQEVKKEEQPVEKHFKLSPVISPVYGILNENYKKEDIIQKGDATSAKRLSSEKIDLDTVRKKAYGTLEDEIENYLNSTKEIKVEPVKEEVKEEELSDDGLSITDLLVDNEETFKDDEIKNDTKVEPQKEESIINDTNDEEDLFDLIDSLYTGKEE